MKDTDQKKKNSMWNILLAIFIIVSIGTGFYLYVKPKISSSIVESSLGQYKENITECVSKIQKDLGDKTVVGLEYECAIQVAATFYKVDPEKSIQLCIAYNPFITTQVGQTRSEAAINADTSLASATCKSSIEKLVEKSVATGETPTQTEPTIDVNTPPMAQKSDRSNQISSLCKNSPTQSDSGRDVYPIDPKYNDLTFLGQIFTAYNCDPTSVGKIFGVKGEHYTLGSAIWLKNDPNQSLLQTFTSIGFTCGEKVSNASCKKWELWEIIEVESLMKLEPYYENFEADDCRMCG